MRLTRVTYPARAQESAARLRPSRPASPRLRTMHTVRRRAEAAAGSHGQLAEIIDLAVVASTAVLDDVPPLRDVLLLEGQAIIIIITTTTTTKHT